MGDEDSDGKKLITGNSLRLAEYLCSIYNLYISE